MPERELSPAYRFGDFVVDRTDRSVRGRDGLLPLGQKAIDVLLHLLDHHGQLVTKDDLFESVWEGRIVSDSALTSVIKEIRAEIGDDRDRMRWIETVYGQGYRFSGDAVAIDRPARSVRHEQLDDAPDGKISIGDPPLLVVGEFKDTRPSDDNAALAVVMREELLIALSRFREIKLVSETGAAQGSSHQTQNYGIRDYRLDANLACLGDDIRLSLTISWPKDRSVVWADTFLSKSAGNQSLIDKMVRAIIGAVMPRFEGDLLRRAPDHPVDLFDRYFAAAQQHAHPADKGQVLAAIACWSEFVDNHPDFMPAYPRLTRLLNTDGRYAALGLTGDAERARARELAKRFLAYDPDNIYAHSTVGWCFLWSREPRKAQRHFEEAVKLNPYNAELLLQVATGMIFSGAHERGNEILSQSLDLTPFATDAIFEDTGLFCLLTESYDEAEENLSLIEEPTVSAMLYRLLAAQARASDSTAQLRRNWLSRVEEKWAAPEPPDRKRILEWIDYHHPFQVAETRTHMLALAHDALAN